MTQFELIHNALVEHIYRLAETEIPTAIFTRRLRDCNAEIYTSDSYMFLVSFGMVVGIVALYTNILYDGTQMHASPNAYTKYHISKFIEDYNIKEVYTYIRKDGRK